MFNQQEETGTVLVSHKTIPFYEKFLIIFLIAPANPFGSPSISPLQAQMTGVQFSTPSPQAFNQPLQAQMTGFPPQGNNVFTPQGSMQCKCAHGRIFRNINVLIDGQSAFPAQRPW